MLSQQTEQICLVFLPWGCHLHPFGFAYCLNSVTCGTNPGDPDTKRSFTRAKRWSYDIEKGSSCAGEWIRHVCNVAVGDLPWVISSPHMFLNKIRLEEEPAAFRCLELWYRDRVQRRRPLANGNDTFDVSIYASQPFARHHVSKLPQSSVMR